MDRLGLSDVPLSEPVLAATHGRSRAAIRGGRSRRWQEGYLERLPACGYSVRLLRGEMSGVGVK